MILQPLALHPTYSILLLQAHPNHDRDPWHQGLGRRVGLLDSQVAKQVQLALATKAFRVYTATDVIGAELCGALKNVLAIACGASDGFGFGANARAALITRGATISTARGRRADL